MPHISYRFVRLFSHLFANTFFPPSPSDTDVSLPPNSSIDMACVLQKRVFRVGLGMKGSLIRFTSALAAFLATADMNKLVTN